MTRDLKEVAERKHRNLKVDLVSLRKRLDQVFEYREKGSTDLELCEIRHMAEDCAKLATRAAVLEELRYHLDRTGKS